MKYIKNLFLAFIILGFASCTDDFAEINENPNLPTDVGPSNLLSSIIFDPINPNLWMQIKFSSQVMQYFVWTNENAFDVYNFSGDAAVMDAVWSANYAALRNSIDMVSRADGDNGYLAAAKILDAYHLAVLTDIWRNVPNAQGGLGLTNVQPSYDSQDEIFADILSKLEEANTMLAQGGTAFGQGGDVLFGGDVMRWRQMANSLRLKYLMRVSNVDASAQGKFEQIANDASTYPIITSNDNEAVFDITGSAPNVSDFANITTLAGITVSQRFVDQLGNRTPANYSDDDPRMDFFCRMRADGSDDETTARAAGFIGVESGVNESVAKTVAEEHNSTKIRPIFQDQKGLLNFAYIAYSELQFILAEAALKGWNVPESAETYYANGVTASLEYWDIAMPAGFMMRSDIALDGIGSSTDDKLERLMEQKWIAGFMVNMFDMWGDHKRTGKPTLALGSEVIAKGFTAVPNRMFYPVIESQVNSANYQSASSAIGGDDIKVKHWYQN